MPGGRPSKIDSVVDHRNGQPVTAAEKVIELTRAIWRPRIAIAAAAGVSLPTIDNWIKAGTQARAKSVRGERLTARERRYAEFLGGWEKAEGEAVAARMGGIQRAGQGGQKVIKTVTRTRQVILDGKVVTLTDETVTETTAKGEWTALAWQLERGIPDEFGRKVQVTGAGGEPLIPKAERADALAEALEAFQAGVEQGSQRAAEANGKG